MRWTLWSFIPTPTIRSGRCIWWRLCSCTVGDGQPCGSRVLARSREYLGVLLNLREVGANVSMTARGYPSDSVIVAATPLPEVGRCRDRKTAKQLLGIDPEQVVLLTLARACKYSPAPWHSGFVEVVGPAIQQCRRATLLAVGPGDDGDDWMELQRSAPTRVIVPGPHPEPWLYLDAADIYLDWFPFGFLTSSTLETEDQRSSRCSSSASQRRRALLCSLAAPGRWTTWWWVPRAPIPTGKG